MAKRIRLVCTAAALVPLTVLAAACGSSGSSSSSSSSAKATASSSAAAASLTETGSTLMFPLFGAWQTAYKTAVPNVSLTTAGTGSGTGIADASTGTATMGASDAYLSSANMAQYPGLENIPTTVAALMVNYDVSGVKKLNLDGTVIPSLVFAKTFIAQKSGCIVNFSSMAATQAITRVLGYSNAKAAVDNFTKWLAVELAQKSGPALRVNAIAPGFFIAEQNRRLLLNEDGTPTARGQAVLAKTPFKRFGEAAELHGALQFLISDAAAFVTGTILPVDGGFSCFSGV